MINAEELQIEIRHVINDANAMTEGKDGRDIILAVKKFLEIKKHGKVFLDQGQLGILDNLAERAHILIRKQYEADVLLHQETLNLIGHY